MLIHVLLMWLLLWVMFSVSSSINLRNSLMPSPHHFLGLPIALSVLYFELNSGFHSDSVMWHFSSPVSISFFVSLVPASNLLISHLFFGFVSASLYVVHPIFFFYLCSINSLRHCHSRITRHCPGHCERLSFVRLRFRHQCSSTHCCQFLRWS